MLAVGLRGIGAFTAMVLGSVTQYAADYPSCRPAGGSADGHLAGKNSQVPVSEDVVHGNAGRALGNLSARADLVVIGRNRSRSGLNGAGSVRHAVLHHARGPIAIVPSS
jgi:nucleotide-binding universal stress UspA family protein